MKDSLQFVLSNPANKLIAVDLDGTLCTGEFWGSGPDPEPIYHMINYINSLYKRGAHIIIYTARQTSWTNATMAWLMKYDVMYHGLSMQRKPGADVYIDDKALNIDDIYRRYRHYN